MIVLTVYASKPGSLETGVCDPSDYGPEHVSALRDQFRRYFPAHDFVCLSDERDDLDVEESIPLRHGWGGWWSKIELFAYDWGEPVLYCDLDNVLVGDCTALTEPREGFIMAQDWDYDVPNSSLMQWSGDYRWIYETFRRNPEANAANYLAMPQLGDQAFIANCLASRGIVPEQWQRLLPGFFRSRWDASANRLDGGGMILWHGRPKPWQVNLTLGGA